MNTFVSTIKDLGHPLGTVLTPCNWLTFSFCVTYISAYFFLHWSPQPLNHCTPYTPSMKSQSVSPIIWVTSDLPAGYGAGVGGWSRSMGNTTPVCGRWERRIVWIEAHDFQADVQTADGFRLLSSGTPAPAPVTWPSLIFVEHLCGPQCRHLLFY